MEPIRYKAAGAGDAAVLEESQAPIKLNSRQRFLNACNCQPVDRPPVWLMRQAGRALPEYRALKEKHPFLELVQTPELAAEVTLQPVRRFGMDAAILFSDILVVAEAMGQSYRFGEKGGIEMEFALDSAERIARLDPSGVTSRLQYLARALPLVRSGLGERTALIGFAGSPWTLANFMLEGGSAKEFTKGKALFYAHSKLFFRLMEKLTTSVADCLQLQIDAGVDAVQIFDSLGGLLAKNIYEEASARWMQMIVARLKGNVPVIVFGRGVHGNWDALLKTRGNVFSVDWTLGLADVRARLPKDVAVQGNLDPFLLTTTSAIVASETIALLETMRGARGHVFNLGHGVPPDAKLECMGSLVTTVQSFK